MNKTEGIVTTIVCLLVCVSAFGATRHFLNASSHTRNLQTANNQYASQDDFENGNYRMVLIPESGFENIMGDLSPLIWLPRGIDEDRAFDIAATDDGWILQVLTIEGSPDVHILIENVKLWTWDCPSHDSGGSINDDGSVTHWESQCLDGTNRKDQKFNRRADAQARADRHNAETGHNTQVVEVK